MLGLGAQKSGTTWLHETLSAHPQCQAFPIKEVHYFDTVSGVAQAGFVLTHMRAKALRRQGGQEEELAKVMRLSDILDEPDSNHQSYVDLMTEGLAPGSVALDITPAYSMIDDALFAEVASMEPVRFLFIMREPIARFWSGIRMLVNLRGEAAQDFETEARKIVDQVLDGDLSPRLEKVLARGDYAGTLSKLERHVPASRRMVLFFEDLFEQDTLDRICAFLGLASMPLSDTTARLEGVKATLRPDQSERLQDFLRPQYDAVCASFGDAVPLSWHERFAHGTVAA